VYEAKDLLLLLLLLLFLPLLFCLSFPQGICFCRCLSFTREVKQPYITSGASIPIQLSTSTNSRNATAAVASNSLFRAASSSVKI